MYTILYLYNMPNVYKISLSEERNYVSRHCQIWRQNLEGNLEKNTQKQTKYRLCGNEWVDEVDGKWSAQCYKVV